MIQQNELMNKLPPYILTNPATGRHLYKRGWLGLIPLIGGFVGIGLIALGIFRYRDKKLVLIGIAALFFTIAVYGSLFIYLNSDNARKQWPTIVPPQLNTIVTRIEFYKLQNGTYPDSLQQILQYDSTFTSITDPVSAKGFQQQALYNYEKMKDKYRLFSSGIDKIPNTADDIYPSLDTIKTGLLLIKHSK